MQLYPDVPDNESLKQIHQMEMKISEIDNKKNHFVPKRFICLVSLSNHSPTQSTFK